MPEDEGVSEGINRFLKYASPRTLLRFLIARDFTIAKSVEMLQNSIVRLEFLISLKKWRLETRPENIDVESIRKILESNRVALHGYDKKGQAIIVFTVRNHTPGEYPMEDMIKFALVVVQGAVRKSEK